MRPVLFTVRGRPFHAYPVMLYFGIVGGVIAGTRAAAVHGLPVAKVYLMMPVLVAPALVGARLLFVATHWDLFRADRARIWRRSDGGAALYGGLVLAFILSLPLVAALGLPVLAFWDGAAITLLVGMIPTKFGCYLNGCCCGRASASRFARQLPDSRGVWKRRVPSQFLEAALAAALLGLCVWLLSSNRMPGLAFLAGLTGYGLGRAALESTREEMAVARRVNVNSAISWSLAGASALAIAVIVLRR